MLQKFIKSVLNWLKNVSLHKQTPPNLVMPQMALLKNNKRKILKTNK